MADTTNTTNPGAATTPVSPVNPGSSFGNTAGTGMGSSLGGLQSMDSSGMDAGSSEHTGEARSHFSAALAEAKAGAAALSEEARLRASSYKEQARSAATEYGEQARTTGSEFSTEARTRASELAVEGKSKLSEGLSGLSRVVADNAHTVDDNLGAEYGDYVRTASKSLQEVATRFDERSLEELGEDVRQFVRSSPGTAIGLAAMTGYLFARILRR